MNALPRSITRIILGSPDVFEALCAQWAERVNTTPGSGLPPLTATHHFLYLTLRGKDWRRAFPPVTRSRHVDNGGLAQWRLPEVLSQIHASDFEAALLEPFGGVLTRDMLERLRSILPKEAVYPGVGVYWPYDAYEQKAVVALVIENKLPL